MSDDEEWDFSNVDVGTEVAVRGMLRDSNLYGIVRMTRKEDRWEQRGRWTTSHLNRDYVSGERLNYILEKWTPFDFKDAEATIIEPMQRNELWSQFEDGLISWR